MLDVILPGTGALQPLPDRALACGVWRLAGRCMLIDCGEGTQAALRRWDVSMLKIDFILLTHYHGDHIFGLPGMLQSMAMAERTQKLTIFGPEGMEEHMRPLRMLCEWLPYPVEYREMERGSSITPHDICADWPEEVLLTSFPTRHTVPSQGYRLSIRRAGRFDAERARALGLPVQYWRMLQKGQNVAWNGREYRPEEVLGAPRRGITVAYTGDTGICSLPGGLDLLVCEATYAEDEQNELAAAHGHLSFAQAAELARQAGAQELWLTHYSPMVTDAKKYRENAARIFPQVVCAEDGESTTLHFRDE